MAEIIWKGKSSKNIDGLIITDLPPITKDIQPNIKRIAA